MTHEELVAQVRSKILIAQYWEPEFYEDEEQFLLDMDPDHADLADAMARTAIAEAQRRKPLSKTAHRSRFHGKL